MRISDWSSDVCSSDLVGTNFGCNVDELMVDGHFIGLQLNSESILISTRLGGSWVDTLMPPKTLWLHPEGTPFSIKHSLRSYWAGAVLRPALTQPRHPTLFQVEIRGVSHAIHGGTRQIGRAHV